MFNVYASTVMKRFATKLGRAQRIEEWLHAMEVACDQRAELTIGEALACLVQINFRVTFEAGKHLTEEERATAYAYLASLEKHVRNAVLVIPGKPANRSERLAHLVAARAAHNATRSRKKAA